MDELKETNKILKEMKDFIVAIAIQLKQIKLDVNDIRGELRSSSGS